MRNMMFFKRFILLLTCLIPLLLTGCQSNDADSFDPERAAFARLRLGLGYLSQSDESEENIKLAHYNLSLANQYSPNNPSIMLGMALFDQHVGEYQEAEAIYQRITKMEPGNGLFFIHYGSFLCATDRYAQALPQFQKAIDLNRYQWKTDALEQRGYCAIQHDDKETADTSFSQLFQQDPSQRNKVNKVAKIYQDKGDNKIANYLFNITK